MVTADSHKFARLHRPRCVWVIGAIHGEVDRLAAVHDHIAAQFRPGERLVYLGNMVGRGSAPHETIDEILTFRRALLSMPGMMVDDIIYLRGQQEEMWQKLLQLQFAPNPPEVLRWMLQQGIETTLRGYGGNPQDGLHAAGDGAVRLTRWTNSLREAMRAAPGHNALFAALRRAAFTDRPPGMPGFGSGPSESDRMPHTASASSETAGMGHNALGGVLLVSAGLDPHRPLATQGDSFWWATSAFDGIDAPYEGFGSVVRGFDPQNRGIQTGTATLSLDGGAGRDGAVAAGCLDPDGAVLEIVEA